MRQALPTTGVFMQPDPIGFAGDPTHLYRYCGNNAMNGLDPFGLDDDDDSEGPPTPKENEGIDSVSGSGTYTYGGDDSFNDLIAQVIEDMNNQQASRSSTPSSVVPGPVSDGPSLGGGGSGSSPGISGLFGPLFGGNGLFGSVDSHASDGTGAGTAERFTNWSIGAGNAYARTVNWAAGVGPTTLMYGPGSVEVSQMKDSPGVRDALAEFAAAGAPENGIFHHYDFGLTGAIQAGLNPTQQFVGSYDAVIVPAGPNNVIIAVKNTTSLWSATYHLFGSWSLYDRNTFRPGGKVTQYYMWSQPYP